MQENSFVKIWEEVPANVYFGGVLGSIGLSAIMYFMGKKDAAHFIGQWAPTILSLALFNKLLNPSRERTDLAGTTDRAVRENVTA